MPDSGALARIGLALCLCGLAASAQSTSVRNESSAEQVPAQRTASPDSITRRRPVARHGVTLSWMASASPDVAGYNVYRGSVPGGPYTKLTRSLVKQTSFQDSAVQPGATYYYVTTAVDSNNNESAYSNEANATIPIH